MRIANGTLIASSVSLATSWTSGAIYLGHIPFFSVQLVFTGVPEGTFKLQCSNDSGHPDSTGSIAYLGVSNWTDVRGSNQIVSEFGNHVWTVQNIGFPWTRVIWTPSAGTGSLIDAQFQLKGF